MSSVIRVSIIVLASITSLAIFGVMVEDVHSQGAPEPVDSRDISGCLGPDRNQVLVFEADCDDIASSEECRIGTVHPIQGEAVCRIVACSVDVEALGYCAKWGCFLHGCN